MRHILMATGLVIISFLNHQAFATEQAQQSKSAESKAKALEQNTTTGAREQIPAPSATITQSETQAVDPIGTAPLDDALTCLSRTIYWESKGEKAASMEAVANVVIHKDRTAGSLYFHHGEATTNWSAEYIKTAEVGQLSFYKPHDGDAK